MTGNAASGSILTGAPGRAFANVALCSTFAAFALFHFVDERGVAGGKAVVDGAVAVIFGSLAAFFLARGIWLTRHRGAAGA